MPRQRFQNPKLQQSKNGSFFIRPWVDVVTADGLERQKKTIVLGPGQMGKRAAITKKNEVMATINNSDYVLKSQILFGHLVHEYRDKHLSRLGYAQQCKFDWAYKKHIGPAFDAFNLSEITTRSLQEWFNAKQKELSRATRLGLRNIISGIFERSVAWSLYNGPNPIRGVKIFGENDAREKIKLTDEQTRQFLAELPYDVRLLCSVCLFCALRITEALALKEEHLDFKNGLLLIRQSFYRGKLRLEAKTGRGRRDAPMGYLNDDLRRICSGNPESYVFQIRTAPKWGREVGLCRDDRDLNQHFLRPTAKKLGFYYKGFGFRALRREAITEIGSIAGIGQAMSAAGHTHMDMSLVYTLQDKRRQEEAIRSYQERILGKPEGGVQ